MKIISNKREGNKAFIEAEEAYSQFEAAVENAYVDAGKDVRLPGFRPGKAPKKMIEQALSREAIEHHAAQNLVSDLYPKIIETEKLQPVDYPSVEIVQQEAGKPFIFKLTVELYPEVKLGKYKGLKVEKKTTEVPDEEIIKVLGNIQERFSPLNAEGKKDLLPLDDEFAKKVSKFGSLAELKEEIRGTMAKEKQAEAEADLKNQLVAAASSETKVDIPEAMVRREIDIMFDELKTSLAQSGLAVEDYLKGTKKEEKELREEMKKSAEIRVKGKIVLKAVADAEKIEVTPEEMQAELRLMAESVGEELEPFTQKVGEGTKEYIADYLIRRKALDFLAEKAEVKEAKS